MLFTVGVITPVVPVESQKPKTGSGVRLSGLAMIKPLGSVSLKATPVKSVAGLGLVMVNVMVTLPFLGTDAAENALVMVGGDCAQAAPANMAAIINSRKDRMIKCRKVIPFTNADKRFKILTSLWSTRRDTPVTTWPTAW